MPDFGGGLPGLRKAAILLISLEQELAAMVLTYMDKETIEAISLEIARLDEVSQHERESVLDEFYQLALARKYVEQGGIDYARSLLEKTLTPEEASMVLATIQQAMAMTPFSFLRKAESQNLLTFIQDEHPQTIALILSHLPSAKASEILGGLPAKKQVEVIKRIATMEQTNPDVIREVERGLEGRLAAIMTQEFEEAGGVQSAAEILNVVDRATEKQILETIEEEDPDLVEEIRRLMFVFEDILLVNDRGLQAVLKEIDNEELAMACKSASEELKDKVFRNMSERARSIIQEEMEYMGPVRLTDVEQAQQRIVDVVRRLEDAGEVIIQGRGGEDELLV